ncbi:MAG: alpha/beta fold hydrolase [Candidatus Rokubacteria bacterium]|nr:alpha/beta fold hydrolase [Candidatus Rokubacteria bacterium]
MPEVRLRGGESDGLTLHYLKEGRGPAVVLLHGLGGFAASWRWNMGALAAGATVYALDLPGFGLSAKPARAPYDLTYFARAVHGFLTTLGIARASLVGHSLGGTIAMTYALTYPARVDRLALIGAIVPGFTYRLSWAYKLAALRGVGEIFAMLRCSPLYKVALARCFHAPTADEIDFLVESSYRERTGWDARLAYLGTLRGVRPDFEARAADYRRALGTLDAPLLLIHGRRDPVVAAAHCRDVAAALPRVTVRWIDACGHFPQIEHAAAVNDWLAGFLAGRAVSR